MVSTLMPTKFPKHSHSERGHRKYLRSGIKRARSPVHQKPSCEYTRQTRGHIPFFKPSINSRHVLSILSTTCVIRVSTEVDSSTLRNRFSLSDLSWLSRSWFLLVYIYSSKPTTQLLCGKLKGNVSVQNLEMLLKIERNNRAQ